MKYFAAVLLVLTACGSSTPPPVTPVPPPAKEKPIAHAPASKEPLFLEFVVLTREWVEKWVPSETADVKAWAPSAPPSFWHILVKVDAKTNDAAAQKKAQGLLNRIKKGEDWGKLARANSDNPGSRERAGEWPAEYAKKSFVPELVAAFDALKPGEVAPKLVKTGFGYHVVRKATPSDDELAKLYRSAKSAELTKKLGADLTDRMRKAPADARANIAEAVQAVLGESAVADPDRPKMSVVDRERVKDLRHLSTGAKAGFEQWATGARPGDVLDTPAADDEMVIVARAVAAAG